MSTKRSHPHLLAATSMSNDSEVDNQLRRGKRQCHDNQCAEQRSWLCQYENRRQTDQEPRFATTSAQFNLFSRPVRRSAKNRRLQSLDSKASQQERQKGYLTDLVHLRSSAFWELRQSITANGDGLVRRMREYEHSRSRHQVHQKAKDAEKRGRKRVSQRAKRIYANVSDASEDEDILICSGEPSNHISRTPFLDKRARSLDAMDIDDNYWQHTQRPRPSSAPHTRYTTNSAVSHFDEEDAITVDDDISITTSPEKSSNSAPSLSNSSCVSARSSVISLPLPSSTLANPEDEEPSFSLPSTASEKTLAALSLALANGAGSINDYSSVWNHEEGPEAEYYDNGDLWH